MEMNISKWVHPVTGDIREYINNWAELLGLEVGRYKTGNVSWAIFRGEDVANRRATALLKAKVWRDKHGDFHVDYLSPLASSVIHKQDIIDFFSNLENQ